MGDPEPLKLVSNVVPAGQSTPQADARQLHDRIESLLEEMRSRDRLLLQLVPIANLRKQFDELVERGVSLQEALAAPSLESSEFYRIKQEAIRFELRYRDVSLRMVVLPTIFGTYAVFGLALTTLRHLDIAGTIKSLIGVQAPERLLTFGVSGAFLHLTTTALKDIGAQARSSALRKGVDFALRLSIAVLAPVVLVGLFFNDKGEVQHLRLSPDLLAFVCGYSATWVTTFLSKIVEKGNKVFEAI